ncbi:MAG TPA: hypothetical protein VGC91_07945 [Pyrinomonadaceae bacterium]|jgi:hypothetical protein
MQAENEIQDEWPDVIEESEAAPPEQSETEAVLAWMSEHIQRKDEWLLELGDRIADLRVETEKLKTAQAAEERRVHFWREWAMIATGTVIISLVWLVILIWWQS